MLEFESRERSCLTKLSHNIEPIIRIGKNGLTESILAAVDDLLNNKELIKIKFIDFKDDKLQIAGEIALKTDSFLVRIIGNIAIFYRMSPEPEKRSVTEVLHSRCPDMRTEFRSPRKTRMKHGVI
ncbi:MAG: YhbY family RNA-binding protein [Spirochaetes bacterium]|nr:YhbY family RNA-binding protein [Spirochaetota bacterium]